MERLLDEFDRLGCPQTVPLPVQRPQIIQRGKFAKLERAFDRLGDAGAVVEQETVAIAADGAVGTFAKCSLSGVVVR